ncbi:MAG: sigma-70 family RNA polymerase sigma factor [Ferruginibacter sp.]
MQQQELIPHLFRTEFSRITSVLCRSFGIEYLQAAEDITSETFLSAMETWPYKGVPANPAAWLYTVAKNKAHNYIKRSQIFQQKIAPGLIKEDSSTTLPEIDLSEQNITDSQLQMLFAICHPSLPAEAQIGLALRILCGFGIEEIANALLSTKDAVEKKLYRAKEKLRTEKVSISFPGNTEMMNRLDTALTTLYLLFNEGYYSESSDAVIREDLCWEAMRLMTLLAGNEQTRLPQVNALLSLMCFHASRFAARRNASGEIILYHDQDESLWNQDLINKGVYYLNRASRGELLTKYHLEAGIAYWHTVKEDSLAKWDAVLQLYNRLLQVAYSPIAALNRTYALAKVHGKTAAISEAEKLQLHHNHYYFTLLGDLYTGIDNEKAKQHLDKALALAKTVTDKKTIREKLERL